MNLIRNKRSEITLLKVLLNLPVLNELRLNDDTMVTQNGLLHSYDSHVSFLHKFLYQIKKKDFHAQRHLADEASYSIIHSGSQILELKFGFILPGQRITRITTHLVRGYMEIVSDL